MGFAQGGLASLPQSQGYYLGGTTDGMADQIPASINGSQPAALSDGEFVMPADVVSHLGNGNSDAGAKVLYSMMDRVRQARTGRNEQGREITPNKYTPVRGDYMVDLVVPQGARTAEESSLSSFAGPYVTQMLGRGAALSNMPYQAYGGPLTAGASNLQTQAYQGLGALQTPTGTTYNPMSFTGAAYTQPSAAAVAGGASPSFTPASGNVVQQYMTPYLQSVLDPQYAAARRQSEIQQQQLQSQYGKAGAYGGSRQGVAEAELQRGLLDRMAGITGTGYNQAFEQAQNQFNTEQAREMAAAGQAQRYGLDVLGAQRAGGTEQRAIEQQGITADLAQFTEERDDPKRNLLFMQSLLQGLPLETQTYSSYEPSGLQSLATAGQEGLGILDMLKKYGLLGGSTSPTGGGTPTSTQERGI
jgi:hypothetical protein